MAFIGPASLRAVVLAQALRGRGQG